jgi:hypothetical protein
MKLATFVKSPAERKRYVIDYTDWLDTGETVVSTNFTVSPSVPTTGLVVDAVAIDPNGKEVVFFTSFGTTNVTYTVEVLVQTSGGQVKEDTVVFSVRDQ